MADTDEQQPGPTLSDVPPALIEAAPPAPPTEIVEHRLGGRVGLRVEQVPGGIHHVRVTSQQLPSANANAVPAQELLDLIVGDDAAAIVDRIRAVLLERIGAR